jgi:osmotically inducible lipoprotein OsmB
MHKNPIRIVILSAAAALTLLLAGCGADPGERAVSGGLIGAGAGAGAAIGAAAGDRAASALIGGVAGAATGTLTSPCDLDLGDPWSRDHGALREYERRCGVG